MLVAPTVALAGPNDPALIQFKLPNGDAHHEFEQLGFDMDHSVQPAGGGAILVSAWVTDEEKALAEAHGYPAVKVIHDKFNIDRIRADIATDVAREKAASEALRTTSRTKAKAAVPRTVRAQRADFYESTTGRFISIEANTTEAQITCSNPDAGTGCSYTGPTLRAAWYDAQNNLMGEGNLSTYIDTDTNPDHYQYHYQVFRIGTPGDGGPDPAYIKVSAPNGDVDTIDAKEWIAKNPPGYATGFKRDFITRYHNGPEAYQKMRDLAAEFPNISEAVKLPETSTGYQRKAQTMLGYQQASYVTFDANGLPTGSTSSLSTANAARAVVLTAHEYGHLGGNDITAQLVNPGANDAPLTVTVNGKHIAVSLATDASGAITSTAKQVVDAINANAAASALVLAHLYRTSAGDGVVVPSNMSPLSDLLRAPASVPRGPIEQTMLRIGKQRDGSKVGVFLYCQEHGNEIATSGVCIESAERLLRNYGTDAETTQFIDNLDIFIVPQINGDGATHSLYDSNRRKNLTNYCTPDRFPGSNSDPAARNSWGVDMNRNFTIGSVFDGFQGASNTSCTSGNYSGPFELSEKEVRNEVWVQAEFPNIKFANNIHSSGNLFMWPPGAYKPVTREPLPYPPYGTLNFFDQTAKHVLDGIKADRGTAILPQRTGPVIDVLYSAAGNSADNAYYVHGIIGYDFEIGNSQQPPIAEGKAQANEFANGNYGLLRSAYEYANDTAAPVVDAIVDSEGTGTYDVRFKTNEASSIYYTTDGSTPTTASTEYAPPRPRALPLPVVAAPGTTLKWIAHDFKGNMSAVKSLVLGQTDATGTVGGSVPATLSLTVGQASFGAFVPGVARTYTASAMANVISSAGDAQLSVSDPSSTATGRLVNGAFSLAQPVRARVAPTALADVGGSAAPTPLKSWTAPTSNEAVTVDFSQSIAANEALRTGSYSKTLTFTLSTSQP
jgi:hypothetical protein